MEIIAGKPSSVIGNKDETLILRGSSVKVQWGNKFIDLIKNGKINVDTKIDILKTSDSIDSATKNGIYLINDEVWLVLNGSKINLTSKSEDLCVSFLTEQLTTPELKYQALTNIGLFYESLGDAQEVTAGIVYVASEGKLYIVKDGQFNEYKTDSELGKLDELIIGDLRIHKDKGVMTLTSPSLNIMEYLIFKDLSIIAQKDLEVEGYLLSIGATSELGYRLYMLNGKSILEIDEIIERSELNLREQQVLELNAIDYYSKHNNIITEVEPLENNLFRCTLKYTNLFLNGKVYVLMPVSYTVIAEVTTSSLEESTIRVYILNGLTLDENVEVTVEYDNNKTINVTIPANTNEVRQTIASYAGYAKCISSSDNVSIDNVNPKKIAYEFDITSEGLFITFKIDTVEQQTVFLNNCINALVCDSINPYLQIKDNNLDLLDRSKTIEVINEDGTKEEVPDFNFHTRVGVINKEEEPILTNLKQIEEVSKEDELPRPNMGVYSDNFIGLNPLLYNAVFNTAGYYDKETEHPKYPKYSGDIILPIEDKSILDKKFNQVIPDILWVKLIIDLFIPIGTIIMYHGNPLDLEKSGWVICDGENGTPNLENRFIRGSSDMKTERYNDPEGVIEEDGVYKYELTTDNLPKHSHPHKAHQHHFEGSGSDSIDDDYATAGLSYSVNEGEGSSTTSGKRINTNLETETINISISGDTSSVTSEEEGWKYLDPPKKIPVEPKSYSMIFIMKIKNLTDL